MRLIMRIRYDDFNLFSENSLFFRKVNAVKIQTNHQRWDGMKNEQVRESLLCTIQWCVPPLDLDEARVCVSPARDPAALLKEGLFNSLPCCVNGEQLPSFSPLSRYMLDFTDPSLYLLVLYATTVNMGRHNIALLTSVECPIRLK